MQETANGKQRDYSARKLQKDNSRWEMASFF